MTIYNTATSTKNIVIVKIIPYKRCKWLKMMYKNDLKIRIVNINLIGSLLCTSIKIKIFIMYEYCAPNKANIFFVGYLKMSIGAWGCFFGNL